ncbi:MAG: ABC transporter permease [Ignavibacteriae bacterium]|nr:MAG: ABC transporter permease [Ignavibacteriota bacterium]
MKTTLMVLNILPIVRKEFRQIKRDKRILSVLLFVPALMLLMFGYALNFDVKHTSMAVYDEDRTSVSRAFIEQFFISEYFDKVQTLESKSDINTLLDGEHARVVLVIPSTFTADIQRGRNAAVQVIVDGTNSNAAATVLGYVNAIIQQYSVKVMTESLVRMGRQTISMPVDYQPRVWYNPELKSAKFLVPGLIAFILMVTAVISTALAIVRERELGTMEQLMVSPVKPVELILGKTIPYTVISSLATVAILFLGYVLFDVSIKGSILLLSLVTFIFLVGSLGMGILISTVVETQQLAFMIAVIVSMLPTFILSGFVFPIRNMPMIIQGITYIMPARYFLVALRAIILKGAGLSAFWDQAAILLVYAVLMIGISSLRMRKILT